MGERRCNERNIPLTVTQMLDDSGIGTSLRELKEESGLPCRPLDGNLKEKKKYNVSFQLADSTNCVSAVEKGTEQKSSQLLTSESLFETPPNSLLENVPIPVLSKVAELEVSGKLGSRTQSEENSIQEENLSEATLTSSSLNERDPPADKSKESHKVVQNVAQCPNKELSDLSSTVTDQEKYNPKIPVSEWCADKNREAKSSSDQQNCYNEGKNLPPEEWTPCKSAKQHVSNELFYSLLQCDVNFCTRILSSVVAPNMTCDSPETKDTEIYFADRRWQSGESRCEKLTIGCRQENIRPKKLFL